MNLPLFTPIVVNVGSTSSHVDAQWEPQLPAVSSINSLTATVLSEDNKATPKGLYVSIGGVQRYVAPFEALMEALHNSQTVALYINVRDAVQVNPAQTVVYVHGGLAENLTEIPARAGDAVVYVAFHTKYGTVKEVNGLKPDENGVITIEQFVNYSVSVPAEIEPGSTLFYQELVDAMVFQGGTVTSQTRPSQNIDFKVRKNGTDVGVFRLGPSSGSANLSLTDVNPGDVLSIVSPADLFGAAVFSFVLTFKRS